MCACVSVCDSKSQTNESSVRAQSESENECSAQESLCRGERARARARMGSAKRILKSSLSITNSGAHARDRVNANVLITWANYEVYILDTIHSRQYEVYIGAQYNLILI